MNVNTLKIIALFLCTLNVTCLGVSSRENPEFRLKPQRDSSHSMGIANLCFKTKKLALPSEAIARSRAIAEQIWKMDNTFGLTKAELKKACLFIEKAARLRPKKRYYSKKELGIPCTISKVPSLNGYLISDLPNGCIGSGAHKTVRKAILYADTPKIIASCLCDESGKAEVRILRKLHHCLGIVPLLGVGRHSHKKLEFWLEFYPEGTLHSMRDQKFHFTQDQMLKISKDVARGLLAMHQRHLIHRDLHLGNILLRHRSSGLFDAVLVDFGKAMRISKATKKDMPQTPKSKNPPEILVHSIKKMDRKAVDVYALGCVLYTLFWNEDLPWAYAYNPYKMKGLSRKDRRVQYQKIVASYRALKKKRVELLKNKPSLTAHEQAKLLIFSMIDYIPSRRPSMVEVVKRLDELVP